MSKIDKISIAITREQHEKIKAAVDRGDYASTSEVIRTALREWELKEELRRIEGERIGRLWDEGLASGPAVEGPPIMELLRAKYAELEKGEPKEVKSGKKRARKAA
jgi:antitoxin ParD1/3/4